MNDEENKAIKIAKGITEDDLLNYWEGPEEPYNAIQTILNLIEKQSKEIEELNKENTRQHELIGNIHQKWKDKIKARIEELNDGIKRDMINHDKLKDKSWKLAVHRSIAQKIEIKKVLQSLLEKE